MCKSDYLGVVLHAQTPTEARLAERDYDSYDEHLQALAEGEGMIPVMCTAVVGQVVS